MPRSPHTRYWIAQALGWGSFTLVNVFFAYTLGYFQDTEKIHGFFGRLAVFILLGVLATHSMRGVVKRLETLQKSFEKQIAQFLTITLVFSLVVSAIYVYLIAYLGWLRETEMPFFERRPWVVVLNNTFSTFLYFFIWNLIYFIYHYVAKSRRQQLDTLRLEAMVKELELHTIKAHINPHFIFNALNSIRALVDLNPVRARTAITELSNILRSSLKAEKGETVPLRDELRIVRDYLALEHIRFEDRLQVQYDIDEETLTQELPPMMLQTLAENAIKHGISKEIEGGVVRILSKRDGDHHCLSVQNTGVLERERSKDGFGLSSTFNRLYLLYGEAASFRIHQLSTRMVEAEVRLPLS